MQQRLEGFATQGIRNKRNGTYPCIIGRPLKRRRIEEVEKSQESGFEKGNPMKEAALAHLTICDRHKDEKDGIPREEIENGESEAEESMIEEDPEGLEGEEVEEKTWPDEEPRGPIVQTWSNPLYNPDPLRIY